MRDFASYKTAVQGCSQKTVDEYLNDLRTFSRYLAVCRSGGKPTADILAETEIASLDDEFYTSVTAEEIYNFITFASDILGNKRAAKARKLSTVKVFYKYLTQKKHIMEKSPAADIEGPKAKRSLPKYLSITESVSLLEAVKNDTDSKTRARDFAILTLFLNCGMRLSELAGISLSDLEPTLASVRVIGKGSKERVIYLNNACRAAIADYLPVRYGTVHTGPREDALFLSSRAQRISVKTVQWMVKKYLGLAGLEYKHYSTHKLRHTAATLMYQTGEVDIRVLKDILGHEQLTTTQIYTHVSDKGMRDAMEHNPLADIEIKEKHKKVSSDAVKGGKERK